MSTLLNSYGGVMSTLQNSWGDYVHLYKNEQGVGVCPGDIVLHSFINAASFHIILGILRG